MSGNGQNPNPGGNRPPNWTPYYYPPAQPPRQAPQPPYPQDADINSAQAQMMETLDRRQPGYHQPVQQVTGVPPTYLGFGIFPPAQGRGQAPGGSAPTAQPQPLPSSHRQPWTPQEMNQIAAWREEKLSWNDIGKKLGRSPASCKNQFSKDGRDRRRGA